MNERRPPTAEEIEQRFSQTGSVSAVHFPSLASFAARGRQLLEERNRREAAIDPASAIAVPTHKTRETAPALAQKERRDMFPQKLANALADRLAGCVETLKKQVATLEARNKGLVHAVRVAQKADGGEADLDAVQKAIKAIKKALADSDDAAGDLKKIRKALDAIGGDTDTAGDEAEDESADTEARSSMAQRMGLVAYEPGVRRLPSGRIAFGDVVKKKLARLR